MPSDHALRLAAAFLSSARDFTQRKDAIDLATLIDDECAVARCESDERLRKHYAERFGIYDPEDSTPCWEDVIDAAVAAGRKQERVRTSPLVFMVRQAYVADAVAPWFDVEGNGLKAALATWQEGKPEAGIVERALLLAKAPVVEVIPWSQRPAWLVALLDEDGDSPVLGPGWWTQGFRDVDGAWQVDPRDSRSGCGAYDVRVVLMAPPDRQADILDVNEELFDYGTAIYWIEAETPHGRRLIALLTDS